VQEIDLRSEKFAKRKRTLTEKGKEFQFCTRIKALKSKRNELSTHNRQTIILRGQSESPSELKREFSKAQVLLSEFSDVYSDIKALNHSESEQNDVDCCYQQITEEWSVFERDMRAEIEHLEKLTILKLESDGGSYRTRTRSKGSSRSRGKSVKDERLELEKEKAVLEVKLAFAGQQTRLKIEQEEEKEKLRLNQEIAENSVKLMQCV